MITPHHFGNGICVQLDQRVKLDDVLQDALTKSLLLLLMLLLLLVCTL